MRLKNVDTGTKELPLENANKFPLRHLERKNCTRGEIPGRPASL